VTRRTEGRNRPSAGRRFGSPAGGGAPRVGTARPPAGATFGRRCASV